MSVYFEQLKTRKLEDLVRQIHNPKSNENSAGGKNEGRVDIGEKGDIGSILLTVNFEITDLVYVGTPT